MSDIKKLPRGFIVEFEDFGDGTNNVYLSKQVNGKEYSGSLTFVEDFGELEDNGYGYTSSIKVPDSIFKMAYDWAISKGW